MVYVQNRNPDPKGDEDEESTEPATEAPKYTDDSLLTPTSSVEQGIAPITTPIDAMPLASGRSILGSFSIPEPLSFEAPSRQHRHYYAFPPHYTNSFTQSMLSTPVAGEMISPHDVSVFDYSQNPFPVSTLDHQSTAPGQYDAWTPIFRQSIFRPVDYSAPQDRTRGAVQHRWG